MRLGAAGRITTSTAGAGNGAEITLQTGALERDSGGDGYGIGIALRSHSLVLSELADLRTDADGQGRPGELSVEVAGRLTLSRLGPIDARRATDTDTLPCG